MATKKSAPKGDDDASKTKQPAPKAAPEKTTITIITRAGQTIEIEPADWPMWRLRSARKPDQDEPEVKRGTNNP